MNAEVYTNSKSWVGDYTTSSRSSHPIVWLLGGGYSYNFRSLTNRVTIHDTSVETKTYNDIAYAPKDTRSDKLSQSGTYFSHGVTASSLAVGTGGAIESGFTMEVNGKVRIKGGVTADANYVVSDARVKEHVEPVVHALERIQRMRGVTHTYRQEHDAATGETDAAGTEGVDADAANATGASNVPPVRRAPLPHGRHYGFLAQEIEAVVPELVATLPDGLKAVQYEKVVVLLTEAIKEVSHTMSEMRNTIERLSDRLERLEGAPA